MKKFGRSIAVAFIIAAMLLCTACSGKEAAVQEAPQVTECSIAGNYTLCAYADNEVTGNEEELAQLGFTDSVYLNINSDGTGELAMDVEGVYSLTVDEENRTFKMDNGETLPYSTTDSKIVVTTNTDLILTFKKAGTTSDISSAIAQILENKVCSIAGYYTLNRITNGSEVMDKAALDAAGMADGTYVSINADGTGEMAYADDGAYPITVDEASSIITDDVGESLPYTVDGSALTLHFPDDMTMVFEKQDSSAEASDASAEGGDLATVDYWYGWIADEDDNTYDVWGVLGTDEATGRPYLELFEDPDSDPVFSAFVSINYEAGLVTPEIGEDDAWLYDTMLTAEDADNCFIYYEEGELVCGFNTNGEEGFEILANMRPEGAEWPEDELLPPGMRE